MRHTFILLFALCLGLLSVAQETWLVDNPHSNLRFEVGWEDFSMRTGEFKIFEGSMETESREDLSNAAFTFKVDASSVDVIADRLSGHVKSDRFLDVEKYPEITFSSKGAEKQGDGSYVASGKLKIHDIEKEQEVSIQLKGNKETRRGYILGIEVTLVVNRMDYGLDWGSPRLAENITLVGHLLYKLKTEEE